MDLDNTFTLDPEEEHQLQQVKYSAIAVIMYDMVFLFAVEFSFFFTLHSFVWHKFDELLRNAFFTYYCRTLRKRVSGARTSTSTPVAMSLRYL